MAKEARTAATLGRGQKGEVAQVGTYRTVDFQNVDGSSASAATVVFEADQMVRIQVVSGDCWITRQQITGDTVLGLANVATATIDVDGSDFAAFNDTYTYVSDKVWTDTSDNDMYWNDTLEAWVISNDAEDMHFVNYAPVTTFPNFNWSNAITGSITGSINTSIGAPDEFEMTAPITAVDQEGLLLPEGGELTMLVFKDEALAFIGGSVNIVPVAE